MSDHGILNYNVEELMQMLGVEDLNETEIIEKSKEIITKALNQQNVFMAEFHEEIRDRLLEFIENIKDEEEYDESNKNGNDNESDYGDNENDENENDENENKDEIAEMFLSEIKQGELNPLENKTEKKFLVLDSQLLPENVPKTNYIINLSEQMKRVVNLKLHSYSIPFNWYLINSQKQNNVFHFIFGDDSSMSIIIDYGNYNITQLVAEINSKINIELETTTEKNFISYNPNTGKIKFDLSDTELSISKIVFFDKDNILSTQQLRKTTSLGWLLGFRTDYEYVAIEGNIGTSIPDVKGPKYLYIILDDFKRNRTTNNLVTIADKNTEIKMPSYYSNDILVNCDNNNSISVLPSVPRKLTQAQIYTINEIIKNKDNSEFHSFSPNESDILAVIPLKHNGLAIGDRIVEMSGQLQDSKREYYGPVNIDRLGIKLIDDRGFILDLNGSDWTMSLIYEYVYQY